MDDAGDVPEEGAIAPLTRVVLQPGRRLLPWYVHVPYDKAAVVATRDELFGGWRPGQGEHFTVVALGRSEGF